MHNAHTQLLHQVFASPTWKHTLALSHTCHSITRSQGDTLTLFCPSSPSSLSHHHLPKPLVFNSSASLLLPPLSTGVRVPKALCASESISSQLSSHSEFISAHTLNPRTTRMFWGTSETHDHSGPVAYGKCSPVSEKLETRKPKGHWTTLPQECLVVVVGLPVRNRRLTPALQCGALRVELLVTGPVLVSVRRGVVDGGR